MKIAFLVFHGFYAYNGISKKIESQVSALRELGHEVAVYYYDVREDGGREWKVDEKTIADLGYGIKAKISKRIDLSPVSSHMIENGTELLYYRYFHNASPATISMVQRLRKAGIRTVIEVPTYPYDGEYGCFSPKLLVDKMFRHNLFGQADKAVTFSDAEKIFGCPTIRISNGLDFSRYPIHRERTPDGTLRLIAVAEIHFWHGFDRLINGIGQYKAAGGSRKIHLDIVGPLWGEREETEIKGAVERWSLNNSVSLHGAKFGSELDALFDGADIAIGSLARHRSGISTIRTLKNREYAARGLRFIYSETDPDFEGRDYILKVPADESPVDIESIVRFADFPSPNPEQIRESIKHLSWKAQMLHVIESV